MDDQRSPDNSPPPAHPQISRRALLRAAGASVIGVAGAAVLYEVLAHTSPMPHRVLPPRGGYPLGQYQIADYGMPVIDDPATAIQINIPPQWNVVVTTTLTHTPTRADQQRLSAALAAVESAYAWSPTGVFTSVGYGLPYFRACVPASIVTAYLPRMIDTDAPVLLDAIRFSGDPATTVLEANDVVFHLRSDSLANLRDVQRALFEQSGKLAGQPAPHADLGGLFRVTSVRTGFVGAGLPRRMASQAGLPYASAIPASAPLFMGFTSTQTLGQAREETVRFDGRPDPNLSPLTTAHPGDYFAGGTALHVSHLYEDLAPWYQLAYDQRATRMFQPNVPTTEGRVTIQTSWLNPNPSQPDAQDGHLLGHNEAVQRGSRTPEGQALQLRVDFNTMDAMDGPAGPGLHFLAFTPGSQIFHDSRKAMDATDITRRYAIASVANGINSFIHATRRQNFLVPPRAHRSFPLLEFALP